MNSKGDTVISRQYRNSVSVVSLDLFRRSVVAAKETGTRPPVTMMGEESFLYTRHRNLYFVAITNSNINPAMVFEFLFQKIKILQAYLGPDFDEGHIRANMTLLYELFDEVMDFGYPQNCAIDVLKLFLGAKKQVQETEPSQLTRVVS